MNNEHNKYMNTYKLHKAHQGFIITENSDVTGTVAFDYDTHSIMFFDSHPRYNESGEKIIAIDFKSETYPQCSLPMIDFSELSDEDNKKIDRYNIDELGEEYLLSYFNNSNDDLEHQQVFRGFCKGFKKAQELLVNKVYTLDDLINAAKYGYEFRHTTSFPNDKFEDGCINNFKQKLQSLENKSWDIEILEKYGAIIKITKIL